MRATFHPHLPNGPGGDPVVWVDVQDEGHALLLDLGDLRGITNRRLLRVDRVSVSHTHMDHFQGFDQLLRLALRREKQVVLSGPAGFLENVRCKLGGYTWNLIDQYPLRLVVQEIDGGELRQATFDARRGLAAGARSSRSFDGLVHAGEAYSVHAAVFDHDIPVLGYALREGERLSVDKDRLACEGLQPGPWLHRLKSAVRAGASSNDEIDAEAIDGSTRRLALGGLAEKILRRTPGQSVGYLTDLGYSRRNIRRAVSLAGDVQLLICEAMFLQRDEALARERNHLTARQAGELARAAGARKLAPFHFSPRYEDRDEEFFEEAAKAFGGPVVRLPPC